jgi:ABC-type nitrate/sulfonate/bicarbonate transport system substrate-binding protein
MTRRVTAVITLSLLAVTAVACGDDDDTSASTPAVTDSVGGSVDTTPATGAPDTGAPGAMSEVVVGEPFPADRCAANKAAGTITYLSSFDFAATASIVEVLVAKEKGYFDELCLDVEVKPSFSVANYPELAANNAQFSSAGSFSEVIDYATKNDASFVALAVEGKTGIDALIVKEGQAATLEDLRGSTIGIKGAMTTSVSAMLKQAGLTEGSDYTTVLLDGFDPKVHIEVPNIVGFPGYKSNEPLQLAAAGIPFTLFDPAEYDIPGSFGVLYTNGDFLAEHPTAVQDFIRASMLGLSDAIADPDAAADIAIGFINANGNAMFLSPEGERARWGVESALVVSTNTSTALGVPEPDLLTEEVTTYAEIGLFEGTAPDISPYVDIDTISGVYGDDRAVIWPAAG